jgi:hypothetical protein
MIDMPEWCADIASLTPLLKQGKEGKEWEIEDELMRLSSPWP